MNNTDIPTTDKECWIKYPKFRWMFETNRLFDSQNKKWSFVKDEKFDCVCPMSIFDKPFTSMFLKYSDTIKLGEIYVEDADNANAIHTDVLVVKGDIKWFKHWRGCTFQDDVNADVELRITAFIILNFHKWNGVLSIKTIGHEIYAIKLMPSDMLIHYPEEVNDQIKKIYKIKS